MDRCPFATWHPISGSSGPHVGGPFKIVHHTIEGSTAFGALDTFAKTRSDPHFTVDATNIFQHIDTAEGARALRNAPGGVQTNRDSAVQIELIGFAHLSKDKRAHTTLGSHDCPMWHNPGRLLSNLANTQRFNRACRVRLEQAHSRELEASDALLTVYV